MGSRLAQRYEGLDRLRGIAALSVVFYHYFFRYDELSGHDFAVLPWLEFGLYGVQLFFVISGFVISLSLEHSAKLSKFIVWRFSRLYPVYWACVLITFISVLWLGPESRGVSFGDFLINLTMLSRFFGAPYVDGVYWTLTYELVFYFWAALATFCLLRLWFAIPLVLSVVCFTGMLFVYKAMTFFDVGLPPFTEEILLLNYGPFFLSGVLLYLFVKYRSYRRWISASALAMVILQVINKDLQLGVILVVVTALVAGSLLYSLPKDVILKFFGAVSYPLYLVHQNVGYGIIDFSKVHFGSSFLGALIALVVVIPLSWLLHQFVEMPSQAAIRTWWKRREARRAG